MCWYSSSETSNNLYKKMMQIKETLFLTASKVQKCLKGLKTNLNKTKIVSSKTASQAFSQIIIIEILQSFISISLQPYKVWLQWVCNAYAVGSRFF